MQIFSYADVFLKAVERLYIWKPSLRSNFKLWMLTLKTQSMEENL